jgi:hypothetical protein
MDLAFNDIATKTDWFSQRHAAIQKQPKITSQTRGNAATMNSAGVEALGNPEAILLGFSREYNAIVIRPADPEERGAYRLRHVGGGASTRIFAWKAFATANDLPTSEMRSYLGQEVGGLLVFPLDQGTTKAEDEQPALADVS